MCDRKGVIYKGRDRPRPVEVGACGRRPTRARWRRRWSAPTCSSACRRRARSSPRWSRTMAPGADHLRHGQSRSRNHAARSQGGAARRDHRHRPLGLSRTRSTTSSASRSSSAARSTCARPAINEEMKIAAANALAELAREAGARGSRRGLWRHDPQLRPRLHHPGAVRSAADRDRAVARSPRRRWTAASRKSRSPTWTPIASSLRARLNPTASVLSLAYEAARANPKRVLFAEGEEPNVLRAAIAFKEGGYGTPVLVGREDVYDKLHELGRRRSAGAMKCSTAAIRRWSAARSTIIYAKHQRHGMLRREVERMVNQDRNYLRRGDARAGRGRRDDHRHDPAVQPVAAPGPQGDRRRGRRDAVRDQRHRRPAARRC